MTPELGVGTAVQTVVSSTIAKGSNRGCWVQKA